MQEQESDLYKQCLQLIAGPPQSPAVRHTKPVKYRPLPLSALRKHKHAQRHSTVRPIATMKRAGSSHYNLRSQSSLSQL